MASRMVYVQKINVNIIDIPITKETIPSEPIKNEKSNIKVNVIIMAKANDLRHFIKKVLI